MTESRLIVCSVACVTVCGSGCFACVADGPIIVADAATLSVAFMTGSTTRPQD